MSTEILNQIKKDKILSTKSGDEVLKSYLGVILGEIDRNRGTKEIDDEVVKAVIKKMMAAVKENTKINSDRGISTEEFDNQKTILCSYVPEQVVLSEEETRQVILDIIAKGANNIGLIMKALAFHQVDKAIASGIAKELLV